MSIDENYKKSVELWVEQQRKNIELIDFNNNQLFKEIEIKKEQLELSQKVLEHEVNFLNDYLKQLN